MTTRWRARHACLRPWCSAPPAPHGATYPASAGARVDFRPNSSAGPVKRPECGPLPARRGTAAAARNGGLLPAPAPSSGAAPPHRAGSPSCASPSSLWSSFCPGRRRCTRPRPAPRFATPCTARCPGSGSTQRARPRCLRAASRRSWAATFSPLSTSTWPELPSRTAPPYPPFLRPHRASPPSTYRTVYRCLPVRSLDPQCGPLLPPPPPCPSWTSPAAPVSAWTLFRASSASSASNASACPAPASALTPSRAWPPPAPACARSSLPRGLRPATPAPSKPASASTRPTSPTCLRTQFRRRAGCAASACCNCPVRSNAAEVPAPAPHASAPRRRPRTAVPGAESASEGVVRALGQDADVLGYIRRQREEFKRRGAVCCALPSTAEAIAWVERKGIAVDVFCPANSAEAAAPMPGFTPEPEPGPAAHAESSAPFAEMGDAQRAQLLFEIARDAFVAETFLVTTPLSLCLWERLLYLQPCALGHLHAAWVAYMLFHVERCLCHIVRALQLQPGLGTAWHDLGSLMREMGSLHSALACHTRAAECTLFEESSAYQTWVDLADTHTALRDPSSALRALLQASRAAPGDAEVQVKLQRQLVAARRRWRDRMAREAADAPSLTSVAPLRGANAVPSAAACEIAGISRSKRRRRHDPSSGQPTRRGRVVAPPRDLAAQYVPY